jgi:hypothetical protein
MKKLYILSIILIFGILEIKSQPVLTSDAIPDIGFEFTTIYCDTNNVSEGDAGANQTWDFSDLVQDANETPLVQSYIDPANGEQSSQFPNAEFAQKADTGTVYYLVEDNIVKRLGTGFESGYEKLTDLQDIIKFPLTMGDSYSDEFEGEIQVSTQQGTMTVYRSGTSQAEVDGYGTVITPNGTYNNVLRLKYTQTIQDSTPPVVPQAPAFVIQNEYVSYSYMMTDQFLPVVTVTYGLITYEGSPVPIDPIHTKSVNYITYEPGNVVQKPTTPSLSQPADGSEGLELPITLDWNESMLPGKIVKDQDKTQEDIVYTIQLAQDPTFVGMIDAEETTSETEYTFEDLEMGTMYYWRVSSQYGEETSEWSDPWSFSVKEESVVIPDTPLPSLPADNAKDVSVQTQFEWNVGDNIQKWNLRISSDESMNDIVLDQDNILQPNYTLDFDLNYNTEYFWQLRAYDGTNWSEWSETYSFSTEIDTYINELQFINNIEFAPQPAKQFLNINISSSQSETVDIKILDIQGNMLLEMSKIHLFEGINSQTININNFSGGTYIFVLENSFKVSTQKFIIN